MTEFRKHLKRYFEINYLWLIAINIIGPSLSTTGLMQKYGLYWISACLMAILLSIIVFVWDLNRKNADILNHQYHV